MSILEANNKKLGEILNLAYGSLYIPFNQRPYEWKTEQVSRLFKDFYAIFISDDENKEHVLNFITIKKEEDKKYVFDGQQRIVTSILIIIGLMQRIKQLDNSDNTIKLLSSLERDYLYKEDFGR